MSLVCLSDFEAYAKKHLPKVTWEYLAAGADDSCTRDDNLRAYKRIRLRPCLLHDVSMIDTKTTILGTEISFPVGIAPTGFHRLAWPSGELSTAKAAEAMNTCYIASTYATCSMEEIVAAAPGGFRWFQLYIHRQRSASVQLVRRAEALGFQAVVLTVDVPYPGKRRDDIRNNFQLPQHMSVKNFEGIFEDQDRSEYGLPANSMEPNLSWEDVRWLQGLTHLPIVLKGILTKEDTELAVRHGVQGIIVSNHGGRQLDGVPASIDALVEIKEAVRDKVEIYLDGGVRTGTDVLKALALGAKCVFIGRPALWGLTYKGEEGLQELLQILKDEFRLSMALTGCRNVSEIGRHLVQFPRL
ncbi:2-Hydroxyacid oxidase 2 isoform X1 [Heteronotia binoei]|uniref:2-Hydroxyacid oxidase 2 isoform X1 n=1 Tax=Heteronotia binoei TaxID=13085 RepID=UPI00292D9FAF|nr:2-Hydroxyacid oxidase 2 isoform X1 [Heteronotia binoei]